MLKHIEKEKGVRITAVDKKTKMEVCSGKLRLLDLIRIVVQRMSESSAWCMLR